jgi:type VI protein secretion system component VasK
MFNSYFSTRGVEEQKNWKITAKTGQVPLSFTHNGAQCLTHTRIISKVFFKGSVRREWQINIKPLHTHITGADFVVNNMSTNMMSAQGMTIKWPVGASSFNGHIAFTNRNGNPGMYPFKGQWALMRMLANAAKFSGPTQYTPAFQLTINVPSHAQALAFYAEVNVSTATHPFCNNIFSNFRVPDMLVKE